MLAIEEKTFLKLKAFIGEVTHHENLSLQLRLLGWSIIEDFRERYPEYMGKTKEIAELNKKLWNEIENDLERARFEIMKANGKGTEYFLEG